MMSDNEARLYKLIEETRTAAEMIQRNTQDGADWQSVRQAASRIESHCHHIQAALATELTDLKSMIVAEIRRKR